MVAGAPWRLKKVTATGSQVPHRDEEIGFDHRVASCRLKALTAAEA